MRKHKEKLQEVFDKVKSHLLSQGKRSETDDGTCMYRGDGGLQCAVGYLISDKAYKYDIEECAVGSTNVCSALMKSGIDMDCPRMGVLLLKLQNVHDKIDVNLWKFELGKLATEFDLKD